MTLLLIGIVVWILVLVFACSLGAAATIGDRRELARFGAAPSRPGSDGPAESEQAERPGGAQASVEATREDLLRELVLTKRALLNAQQRLAELEATRVHRAA